MIFGTILGDPHKAADFINSLVASGNTIRLVEKTQTHSTYVIGMAGGGFLLQEDGSFLLLENGFKIVL